MTPHNKPHAAATGGRGQGQGSKAAEKSRGLNGRLNGSSVLLPIDLPRANDLLRRSGHWKRSKFKEACGWELTAKRLRFDEPPEMPVRLTLTRILGKGQRLYDADNLVASTKGLIDAMKEANWFKDDSPAYLKLRWKQDTTRRELGPAVLVEVEGL